MEYDDGADVFNVFYPYPAAYDPARVPDSGRCFAWREFTKNVIILPTVLHESVDKQGRKSGGMKKSISSNQIAYSVAAFILASNLLTSNLYQFAKKIPGFRLLSHMRPAF